MGPQQTVSFSIGFRAQAIFVHIDTKDLLGMLDISVLAWRGEPFEELLDDDTTGGWWVVLRLTLDWWILRR